MYLKYKSEAQYIKTLSNNPELYEVMKSNYYGSTILVDDAFLGKRIIEHRLGSFNHMSHINKISFNDKVLGFLSSDFCTIVRSVARLSGDILARSIYNTDYRPPSRIFDLLFAGRIRGLFIKEIDRCRFWGNGIEEGVIIDTGDTFHFSNWINYKQLPMVYTYVTNRLERCYIPPCDCDHYPMMFNVESVFRETRVKEKKNTHLDDKRLKNFMKHQ